MKVIALASKSALITAALYFWQKFGLYFHTFYPGCFSSQQGSLAYLNLNKITICSSYIAQLQAANKSPPLYYNVGYYKYSVNHMFEKNVFDSKINKESGE